jgi:hypothetical protein
MALGGVQEYRLSRSRKTAPLVEDIHVADGAAGKETEEDARGEDVRVDAGEQSGRTCARAGTETCTDGAGGAEEGRWVKAKTRT